MRHVIPKNVSSDGGILGGAFKKRNATEAGIYLFLCFLFFKAALFFLPIIPKIIVFFVIGIIPAAIMLVGISDQSAVEFFTTKMRYIRRKDIVPYVFQTENEEDIPTNLIDRYAYKKELKSRKKEEKQRMYKRELEFIANDASSTKRQAKKARKKLKREEKIQREEEERLIKIQKKREAKQAKKEAKKAEKEKKKK